MDLKRKYPDEFRLFNNKIRWKAYLSANGIKVPDTYMFITKPGDFGFLWGCRRDMPTFVIKPNHLAQGKGVMVLEMRDGHYYEMTGEEFTVDRIQESVTKSLSTKTEKTSCGVLMEERIYSHAEFMNIFKIDRGLIDIRFYMGWDRMILGMVRVPTVKSRHYANWAQGGAVFHFNHRGTFYNAQDIQHISSVVHPETGMNVEGKKIPFWNKLHGTAVKVAGLFKLPYHTVDMTVDRAGNVVVVEGESCPDLAVFTDKGAWKVIGIIKSGGP